MIDEAWEKGYRLNLAVEAAESAISTGKLKEKFINDQKALAEGDSADLRPLD